MKVLLVEEIKKLGWLGDVVEVSEGFARNYLLPQGLAKIPNMDNLKAIEKDKARHAEIRIEERKRLEKVCEKVNGAEVSVTGRANRTGHLFGSITERDIAENLRNQGFAVADEVVKLDGHIKDVGTFEVTLKYAADLTATVTVKVDAELSEESDSEEEEES